MHVFTFPNIAIPYIIDKSGCYLCRLETARTKDGYYVFNRNGKQYRAHRYTYERIKGEIPDGLVVRHTCDNSGCINPDHLILGSHRDNVMDRVLRERSAIGVDNGRAKLTEQQVKEIKYIETIGTTMLAHLYRVDPKAIRKIKNGETWKHVSPT